MSRKTYKTIETPSGSGELRKAGAHLAKVFYHRKTRRWDSMLSPCALAAWVKPDRWAK